MQPATTSLVEFGLATAGASTLTFGDTPMCDEPIHIKTFESEVVFVLEGGRLKGASKTRFHGREEFAFPISEVCPDPIVLECRHGWFRQGLWTIVLALIAAVFVSMFEDADARVVALAILTTFAAVGVLLLILFRHPYRFLTFTSRSGVPLFRITQTPSNHDAVESLRTRIIDAAVSPEAGDEDQEAEQVSAGQPATRPESKSESNDKP
jgi:hypothetical protein